MNPLRIAEQLRTDYLDLLTTTFSPRQDRLRRDFRAAIEREGFLTREPFVSLAQPYKIAPPLIELVAETRRRFGQVAETPYLHQAKATQRILNGEPVVVATGTGSGKTEAFLMPILDHCFRVAEPDTVKAILVYPMNALANDQRNRIRKLLAGTRVSFGVYTGETKQYGTRPEDAPDNERLTRTEFRAHPPDLLLTNYRMLWSTYSYEAMGGRSSSGRRTNYKMRVGWFCDSLVPIFTGTSRYVCSRFGRHWRIGLEVMARTMQDAAGKPFNYMACGVR